MDDAATNKTAANASSGSTDKSSLGQGSGTESKSKLAQALTDLSGQDGQKVFDAISSALHGSLQDLKGILDDLNKNSASIEKLLGQVTEREQKIQEIDAQLKALQEQIPGLDAQIGAIRGRITIRTDADVKKTFGLDLLEGK